MAPTPTTRPCPACNRDFLPSKCQDHCTNACCRAANCASVRRDYRHEPGTAHCVVCRAPRDEFQAFAPCSEACNGRVFFASSAADPGTLGDGMFRRRWQSSCHLYDTLDGHRPASKQRIHARYCSLKCYNSLAFGHETRRIEGERRRRRTQLARTDRARGWRDRWRTETGQRDEQAARKRIQQAEIMAYGAPDDGTTRLPADDDEAFREVFGNPGPQAG